MEIMQLKNTARGTYIIPNIAAFLFSHVHAVQRVDDFNEIVNKAD